MRDAVQAWVRVWAPVVADQVPPDAAAQLAALALSRQTRAWPEFVTPGTVRGTHDGDVTVLDAVCAVALDLRERLHRALVPVTRTVADAPPPSELAAVLPEPLSRFAVVTMGVALCTPPGGRTPLALAALASGMAVVVEKPAALR